MKHILNSKRSKKILAAALCTCTMVMLLPIHAAALAEGCDAEGCLAQACETEGCLCICHQDGESIVCSEPVTVQTPDLPVIVEEPQPETTAETEPVIVPETVADPTEETIEETAAEPTEETVAETTEVIEEPVEPTEELADPAAFVTVTWLDQQGEVLATTELTAGSPLTEDAFPQLERVGWYLVDAETPTPVRADTLVTESISVQAVDRSVSLSLSGECVVGSEVTLTVNLTGFEGEAYTIQWQNCPIDAKGKPIGEWTAVDANGHGYIFTLTEENMYLAWRAVINVD